ncbi:hypothetical protein GCM10010492_34310 [Saccharothrix mutabilis subsp. mutabilis]|uniref:Uncharacterized protein n=1 Tax=Saccharothrix mutabilis subsp. mutabilis TaxID=66855 RepID=A0ABN0TY12_9PSEU
MGQNDEVFDDFDLVISVTQKAINEQLENLVNNGTIPGRLRMKSDGGQWVYLADDEKLPDDDKLGKYDCYLDVEFLPKIHFDRKNEQDVLFGVVLTKGQALFTLYGKGDQAPQVRRYTIESSPGNRYRLSVRARLRMAKWDKEQADRTYVSDSLRRTLDGLVDDYFAVRHVYCGLSDLDFSKRNRSEINSWWEGTMPPDVEQLDILGGFLQHHFSAANSPSGKRAVVAGYSVSHTEQSLARAGADPAGGPSDWMVPVNATFSTMRDDQDPDLSTLNFFAVTRWRNKHDVDLEPPRHRDNWVDQDRDVDGVLTVGPHAFLFPAVLEPMFDQLRQRALPPVQEVAPDAQAFPFGKVVSFDAHRGQVEVEVVRRFAGSPCAAPFQRLAARVVLMAIPRGNNVIVTGKFILDSLDAAKDGCVVPLRASCQEWADALYADLALDSDGRPVLRARQSEHFHFRNELDERAESGNCRDNGVEEDLKSALRSWAATVNEPYRHGFKSLFKHSWDHFDRCADDLANVPVLLPAGDTFFFRNALFREHGSMSIDITYQAER